MLEQENKAIAGPLAALQVLGMGLAVLWRFRDSRNHYPLKQYRTLGWTVLAALSGVETE